MAFQISLSEARLRAEQARGLWPNRILTDYLDAAVEAKPDQVAITGTNSATGERTTLTYADLARRVERIALGLAGLGVQPGEVVSFQLPNWWQYPALYLACGQDVACVAESAVGVTRFEVTATGALYASVTMPNIIVGTVGGGTGLPSQKACLEIMGLAGPGKAQAFAEVCAAVCLAGELSIIGAICAGDFAKAHRLLARAKARGHHHGSAEPHAHA